LRKDNTGYDLRHLLIGSEGSLGIITAASLRVFPKPASVATALVQVADPAQALDLLARAEGQLSGTITAFELIGQMGVTFLAETMPEIDVPLNCPWMVLIEVGLPQSLGAAADHLETLLADAQGGVLAQSQAQRDAVWRIRENIPEANRRIGAVSSHDISLPLSNLPLFITTAGAQLAKLGDFRINCFGHLGDGNLHYNVFPAQGRTRIDYENQRDSIKSCVHDLVDAMGGSVSAEHGLGRLKRQDLEKYGDPAKLAAMRAIKAALDPKGIMNPGAVITGHTPPDKPTGC
jgi:FAD/FMN-containing dehydrogenase